MAQYLDLEGLKTYHKIVEDLNRKNLKSIVLSENKLNVSRDDQIFSVGFDATAPLNVSMKDNSIVYNLSDGAITAEKIADSAVTTDKMVDNAVTPDKLSPELQQYLDHIGFFIESKAQAEGLASLDSNGKVPEEQLPSYVDDVIEGYLNEGKFYKEEAHTTELTGETGKIYVNLTDNQCYRYTGSGYVSVSDVPAETLRRIDNLESAVKDNKVIIGTLNKASDGTYSITVPTGMTNTEVLKAIQSNHAYIQYGTASTQTKLYHLSSYDNGTSYISMWENTDADNKVLSSFEMQYDTTNDKFNVLKYTENSVASQGDVTTLQTNLTTLQNSVSRDNTALSNRVTALEKNDTIILTLTSYPSGTLELPAGVTVSDAKTKMRDGKAMLNYINVATNISLFYKFNSYQGNTYYFEAVSQYDMKGNTLQGVSMGQAIVLEQNNSLVAKINTLSVATKSDVTDAMVSTTWSDLKARRDAGTLIAGQQYRITDYTCTTTQADTQSAGHQFDIIVTADSTSKLNEQARAILHEGDTYFANSKLEAWKLWYSLDNNKNLYSWADSTNGKGVIYRMIDEWNNDVPYDFKNIQFRRYKISVANYNNDLVGKYLGISDDENAEITIDSGDSIWSYTFSTESTSDTVTDSSHNNYDCNNNIIKEFNEQGQYMLNNIVFLSSFGYISKNSFGTNCYDTSFGGGVGNIFGYECYMNIVCGSDNRFGNNCSNNVLSNICNNNTFGDACTYSLFGNGCCNNILGISCKFTIFGENSVRNRIGNSCAGITLGLMNVYGSTEIKGYFADNVIEDSVSFIIFDGLSDSSSNNYIQNYHVKRGISTDSGHKHYIASEANRNYETIVAQNSNGQVVEYCEADLITVPLTSATIDGNAALTATGTYTYKLNPVPANATDIKSIVWNSNADATYGSIDASTGVATVKQLPPVNASFTITATVTTTSGRTITATKSVTINKAS